MPAMDNHLVTAPTCLCPGHDWDGVGQSTFSGAALGLYRALDALFCRLAAECGAAEHQFPTFLSAETLSRIDYFHGFPHMATFAATLDEEEANLDTFRQQREVRPDGSVALTRLSPIRAVLTPAACYHFYRLYEGRTLDAPLHVTTRATCHRRETRYVPLERQWSFGMREIVCIGAVEEVIAFLERYRTRVAALFAALDLPAEQQVASDPFFRPTQNPRWIAQRLEPVKTEFVFEGRLAAASINFHREYFGEAFNIRRNGGFASSGCVAFGLERWVRMILARWGNDPADWPRLKEIAP